MSVLSVVALSEGKTLRIEGQNFNDLERVGMFTPPGNVTCRATSRPDRLREGPSWVTHKGPSAGF